MEINFVKMCAAGNDFVLIDASTHDQLSTSYAVNELLPALENAQLAIKLCDRHNGVGADQLLIIADPSSANAQFDYIIFNQNGSRATNCGNGARCVMNYLFHKHHEVMQAHNYHINLHLKDSANIITGFLNEKKYPLLEATPFGIMYPNMTTSITMMNPSFDAATVDLNTALVTRDKNSHMYCYRSSLGEDIKFATISLGNPHALILLDDDFGALPNPNEFNDYRLARFKQIANIIDQNNLFAKGVNVNFCHIVHAGSTASTEFLKASIPLLSIFTHERGVGFSASCGSGSVASAVYLLHNNYFGDAKEVLVRTPGGELLVSWNQQGNYSRPILSGNSCYVFSGTFYL